AGDEIIVTLLGHVSLGGRAVVAFAADFYSECRRPVDEFPFISGKWPGMIGRVRRERLPAIGERRADRVADAIGERLSHTRLDRIIVQAAVNTPRDAIGKASCGHFPYNPPGNKFGLTLDTIQIVEGRRQRIGYDHGTLRASSPVRSLSLNVSRR